MPKVLVRKLHVRQHVRAVQHLAGGFHLMEFYRENIGRFGQLGHGKVDGDRMSHLVPLADACVGVSQIFGRYPVQGDHQIVIGLHRHEIARGGRAVQDDGRKVLPVRVFQIVDKGLKLMFHIAHQSPPAPPPPKSPPPPKPPQSDPPLPPQLLPPQSLEDDEELLAAFAMADPMIHGNTLPPP
jgi:hypothetical protein